MLIMRSGASPPRRVSEHEDMFIFGEFSRRRTGLRGMITFSDVTKLFSLEN